MTLKFVDPPPARRAGRPTRWIDIVEQLKANPGRWALVGEASAYLQKAYPGVEATARRIKGRRNKADVYARWNGGES